MGWVRGIVVPITCDERGSYSLLPDGGDGVSTYICLLRTCHSCVCGLARWSTEYIVVLSTLKVCCILHPCCSADVESKPPQRQFCELSVTTSPTCFFSHSLLILSASSILRFHLPLLSLCAHLRIAVALPFSHRSVRHQSSHKRLCRTAGISTQT